MRKAELKAYEARLLELGERLRGTVEVLDREIAEESVAPGDLARFGTHNADHDTEFLEADEAAERTEVRLLEAVEAALVRIRNGTYGYCAACGREIDRARLAAIPHAARCAGCEAHASSS
jgi:RNA polymerase-binding transcription factor DksA